MPTRSFDDPTANRVTGRQVLVVLHPIPVPRVISRRVQDSFPLLPLQTALGGLVPQASDHGCDRAGARDYEAFLGFFSLDPS